MAIGERLASAARSWLGVQPYAPLVNSGTASLTTESIDAIRRALGGQLQPLPSTRTRWYMSDIESCEMQADGGRLAMVAQLMRAARRDGKVQGIMSTRTDGLVRLPKIFRGDADIVKDMQFGGNPTLSKFDEICPPTELGVLAADAEFIGVGYGELVPVADRPYPLFLRHDPEYLVFNWSENQWYMRTVGGLVRITAGDGRWVMHFRGARQAPWQQGLWKAVGTAWIRKHHAGLHKDNWEAKLANPARIAVSPQGAGEMQKQSWFNAVMAWGVNTVFGMTPGYDVKLLESNGRGWESFIKTKAECDEDIAVAIAGQTVTTDGGAGFQNSDVHKSIRADLIKATADALAHTINTQILPQVSEELYGGGEITVEWDVTPPADRVKEANSMLAVGTAIKNLTEALQPFGMRPDVAAICTSFSIPIMGDRNGDGKPDEKVDTLDTTGEETSRLRLVPDDEESAA